MKDFKAISNTIKNELKQRMFGKSAYGNTEWKKGSFEWYEFIHNENTLLHRNFMEYLDGKKMSIKTVLEVGCGAGIYPIKYKELFNGLEYTGIDFSETNIEYCKDNSKFNFIPGDFIKMNINQEYDLVFSHAVIDHVYDIDAFLLNLIKSCKKHAYINAYRGYFPDLEKHEMKWRDDDNCYYNKISIKQVQKILLQAGLSDNQFTIKQQKNRRNIDVIYSQLVIEIDKTKLY